MLGCETINDLIFIPIPSRKNLDPVVNLSFTFQPSPNLVQLEIFPTLLFLTSPYSMLSYFYQIFIL